MRSAALRTSSHLALRHLAATLALATSTPSLAPLGAMSTSTSTDPRSICDRYNDDTYSVMEDDKERTGQYAAAIGAVAAGRVCLDIGTGALALLALMAARAGAKHVYAIEANPTAAAAARALVAAEGFADVVTIIEGYSTDVTLPEKADLLLHEILGEVAGAEGVVHALTDAAARHWAPPQAGVGDGGGGGAATSADDVIGTVLSVPARARSLIAPAEFPPPEYFASLKFPMLAAPGATALKLPGLPQSVLIAASQPFERLDFTALRPDSTQGCELHFIASRDAELRGLAVHIEVDMLDAAAASSAASRVPPEAPGIQDGDGGAGIQDGDGGARSAADISSARPGSHWPNIFFLLPDPVTIAAGARLLVSAQIALGSERPRYTLELRLLRDPGGGSQVTVDATADEDAGLLLGSFSYPE